MPRARFCSRRFRCASLAAARARGIRSRGMLRFLLRRLVVALLVAVTVLTVAFALTRLSGDLAISIAGPNATQQDVEIVRRAYGLDRPLVVQFGSWVARAAVGDFGESYF